MVTAADCLVSKFLLFFLVLFFFFLQLDEFSVFLIREASEQI